MKVLSVDYDYFIEASADFREEYFPDSGREDNPFLDAIIWRKLYAEAQMNGENLANVPVLEKALRNVRKLIDRQNNPICMVANSHIHAYDFIRSNCIAGESLEVYNIDFHHDVFDLDTADDLNCGNWLRKLIKEGKVSKAYWVNREDSDTDGSEAFVTTISLEDLPQQFDLIFICRSSGWTPPHLDRNFIKELVNPIIRPSSGWDVKYQIGIDKSRYIKSFRDAVIEEVNTAIQIKTLMQKQIAN